MGAVALAGKDGALSGGPRSLGENHGSGTRKQKHRHFRHQVRKQGHLAVAGKKHAPLDAPFLFRRERLEIEHRQEVDVGRIVPLVRKQLRLRSAPRP